MGTAIQACTPKDTPKGKRINASANKTNAYGLVALQNSASFVTSIRVIFVHKMLLLVALCVQASPTPLTPSAGQPNLKPEVSNRHLIDVALVQSGCAFGGKAAAVAQWGGGRAQGAGQRAAAGWAEFQLSLASGGKAAGLL